MIVEPMVSRPKFEEYREHFKKYLIMERENGIIQVRMHYEGGEVKWNMALHNALAQAWHVIGNDPENEVMIFTSTGSNWIVEVHEDMHEREEQGKIGYDEQMYDSSKLVENLQKIKKIKPNDPVINPGDEYVIKKNTKAIVIPFNKIYQGNSNGRSKKS